MQLLKISSNRSLGKPLFGIIFLGSFIFLTCTVNAQQAVFRGSVFVKSYQKDNHLTKSAQAKFLAEVDDVPVSEYDTLYTTHYICDDTLISYLSGVAKLNPKKEIQIGTKTYLYDPQAMAFIEMPLLKRMLAGITGRNWKAIKRKPDLLQPYDLNYMLIHPHHRNIKKYAKVDRSIRYSDQYQYGGMFTQIFHPFGYLETLINLSDTDTVEHVTFYQYESDPSLQCSEHLADFHIRGAPVDPTELLLTYEPDLNLIPENDRRPLLLEDIRDTSRYHIPSLEQFAGKLIYLDFWASWCAPCRAETPFLKKIRRQYSEDDLVILSISMDKKEDREKWKALITQLEMNWPNWVMYDGLKSEFAKSNGIRGIPHYLLLDKKGRVMNANAPRPSDERLMPLLNACFNP